jgi:NAD+ synthase (glutamine-hydrolysing)
MHKDPFFGFVRVGAAVPHIEVANPAYNVERHKGLMRKAQVERIDLLAFPELSITGYSCGRFFQQKALRNAAVAGLIDLKNASAELFDGVVVVGCPLEIDGALFNCAVAMLRGKFLGVSVKKHLPNYEEFLEKKWFTEGKYLRSKYIVLDGQKVPISTNLIFKSTDVEYLTFAMPICEEDWVMGAASHFYASNGATVLLSLNGSDELVGKEGYRRNQVIQHSGLCVAAYVYVSAGPGESSTDVAFSGHVVIADNGAMQEEVRPLEWVNTIGDPEILGESLTFCDVDLDHIQYDRLRQNSWIESADELARFKKARVVNFTLDRKPEPRELKRTIDCHPYVPTDPAKLRSVCESVTKIKRAGDVTRLLKIGNPESWIAASGGLDSTARLLDLVAAKDALRSPRKSIHAVTMPGFGTGKSSFGYVNTLMDLLGVSKHVIDIKPLCFAVMKAMSMKPFGIDITEMSLETFIEKLKDLPDDAKDLGFENVQAHVRTLIITRFGFAFGTGDMSELIVGWCTWLADQLGGHYNSQATMPKTLVRFQVDYLADHDFKGEVGNCLKGILAQAVSPELLPTKKDGTVRQKTDDTLGPEEVRDFFMRYFRRYGDTPEKILYLCQVGNQRGGFKRVYTQDELIAWWQNFAKRVFQQRFKNATRVDGAQVGSDSLSPHGNWVVPSDAESDVWVLPKGFDLTAHFTAVDAQLKALKGETEAK